MRQVCAQLFAYLVLGLHNVVLHAQAEVHAQVARRLARGERALLDRHEIFAPGRLAFASCIQSFLDSSAATRGAALGGNKSTFP